jgi:hypothetical protein
MNYGPRFQPTIASNKYTYDERIAKDLQPAGWMLGMTAQQRSFIASRTSANQRKHLVGMPTFSWSQPKTMTPKEQRQQAESAMRERVKAAIDILVFGITELIETPVPPNWDPTVHVASMIKLVDHLSKMVTPALPVPEFNSARKPVRDRQCDNCGEVTKLAVCQYCGAHA